MPKQEWTNLSIGLYECDIDVPDIDGPQVTELSFGGHQPPSRPVGRRPQGHWGSLRRARPGRNGVKGDSAYAKHL
jgi:hypothetical protein